MIYSSGVMFDIIVDLKDANGERILDFSTGLGVVVLHGKEIISDKASLFVSVR